MKTVVLAGAGHSHLEVIKKITVGEAQKNRFLVISPSEAAYYSGMIPRLIMGTIDPSALLIPVSKIARSKNMEFISGSLIRVDLPSKTITLADKQILHYDILSLNVGGKPGTIPSESPETTIYLKPFEDFLLSWQRIQTQIKPDSCFVVIGGGVAAVELATALAIRLRSRLGNKFELHLITQGSRLCTNYAEPISNKIYINLLSLGVKVYYNEKIDQIFNSHIKLRDERRINFDFVFIDTSVEPPSVQILDQDKVKKNSDFISSDRFLLVESSLFATGDCSRLTGFDKLPKSGVTAVHQGRTLVENLRRSLAGNQLKMFKPKLKQLNILITGKDRARIVWGTFTFEGVLAMKLKNWIDERYMKTFRKN